MCVIAVSKKGIAQPTMAQIDKMFENNPDGAGYMYARNGKVIIHKGFMDIQDFKRAIQDEHFTAEDPVVYHFRISTQAGVNPYMTHPFPLTRNLNNCEELDLSCSIGLAHNGVIRMTSDIKETRYSDTALFITDYMTRIIRNRKDLVDPYVNDMIYQLTFSKWAILDGVTGDIVTVGQFENDNGVLFSNATYKQAKVKTITTAEWNKYLQRYEMTV